MKNEKNIDLLNKAFLSFNKTAKILDERWEKLQKKLEKTNLQVMQTNERLRKALSETKKTRNFLNNIIESIDSGIVVVDKNNIILFFNKSAEVITSLKKENIVGKKYSNFFSKQNVNLLNKVFSKSSPVAEFEEILIISSEIKSLVKRRFLPIIDEEEEVEAVIDVITDISIIKKLQDDIIQIDALKNLGEMAASIAHQIRNPLGAIEGFSSLLLDDIKPSSPNYRLLKKISIAVGQLNNIITNLLDYAKKNKIYLNPMLLGDIISKNKNIISDIIAKSNKNIKLNIEINDKMPSLCDFNCLSQCLINLVQNSIQSINDEGFIKIYSGYKRISNKNYNYIDIQDSGNGIGEDIIEDLFKPFFTTKEEGIGLGLAIVKKLIEAMYGDIIILNSTENIGTTFRILLPVVNID